MRILLLIFVAVQGISCTNLSNGKPKSSSESNTQELKPDFNVATRFINEYVEFCNPESGKSKDTTWIERNPLLTEKFMSVYHNLIDSAYKAEPEVGLDFDPIFDGNDFPEKGFEIVDSNNQTGYVTLRGIERNEYTITMKIVKFNNEWLVDGSGIINIPKNKQARRN